MRSVLQRYSVGDVPLGRVFGFDMLVVGTIVNLVSAALALVVYSVDLVGWLAILIFLLPLPYNIALCVFVWRSAARHPSGWSDVARIGAVIWLLAMLVI